MDIKNGGQTASLGDGPLKSIVINYVGNRKFEFWINDSSLSYLTLDELLNLRDEIDSKLEILLKPMR